MRWLILSPKSSSSIKNPRALVVTYNTLSKLGHTPHKHTTTSRRLFSDGRKTSSEINPKSNNTIAAGIAAALASIVGIYFTTSCTKIKDPIDIYIADRKLKVNAGAKTFAQQELKFFNENKHVKRELVEEAIRDMAGQQPPDMKYGVVSGREMVGKTASIKSALKGRRGVISITLGCGDKSLNKAIEGYR